MRKSQKSPKSRRPRRSRVNSTVSPETTAEFNAAAGEFGWPRISLAAALVESALIESTPIASSLGSEANNSILLNLRTRKPLTGRPRKPLTGDRSTGLPHGRPPLEADGPPFETESGSAKAGWLSRSGERHA
jgi:hypothetical protein